MGKFFDTFWEFIDVLKRPVYDIKDYLDSKVGAPIKASLDGIYERLTLIKDGILDIPVKLIEL
ncbi:unnamed protein product, partial [marine sediment metagenome]